MPNQIQYFSNTKGDIIIRFDSTHNITKVVFTENDNGKNYQVTQNAITESDQSTIIKNYIETSEEKFIENLRKVFLAVGDHYAPASKKGFIINLTTTK